MGLVLEVPEEYPWVVLGCLMICLLCTFSFIPGTRLRGKFFTEEFMTRFRNEHRAAFGPASSPSKNGYPDAGNGWYSKKLPYAQWYQLNNAMRTHQNFVESLPFILGFLLVGGLIHPSFARIVTGLHLVGRILFAVGYACKGPNARYLGGMVSTLPLYGLAVSSMVTVVKGLL